MKIYTLAIADYNNYGFGTNEVRNFENEKDMLSALVDTFREKCADYDIPKDDVEKAIATSDEVGKICFGGSYAYYMSVFYLDTFTTDLELTNEKATPKAKAEVFLTDKAKGCFKKEITKDNAYDVICAYYGYRGSEEYEAFFDLTREDDFNAFAHLYGFPFALDCALDNRYWVGGLNYYSRIENKNGGCCVPTFAVEDIVAFATRIIINDATDLIGDYLGGIGDDEKASACEDATSCMGDVFDFSKYFLGSTTRNGLVLWTDTYDMELRDISFDEDDIRKLRVYYGKEFDNIIVHFRDGLATTDDGIVRIEYSTIAELDADPKTDWGAMNIYDDDTINFFQIQYHHHKKTTLIKEDFKPIEIDREEALIYVTLYTFARVNHYICLDGIWGETSFVSDMATDFIKFAKAHDMSYFDNNTLSDLEEEFGDYLLKKVLVHRNNPYANYIYENTLLNEGE